MCRCFIFSFEYTVIKDGTVKVICGECGKYQYHLVEGEIRQLTDSQQSELVKQVAGSALRSKRQSAARVEQIRRELEKYASSVGLSQES